MISIITVEQFGCFGLRIAVDLVGRALLVYRCSEIAESKLVSQINSTCVFGRCTISVSAADWTASVVPCAKKS